MHQQSKDDYLQKPLMTFTDKHGKKDVWTVDDAMKGISILGGTGSGKTSGSGRTLALKYLREGWGGIVLTVKPDETALWKDYCDKAGRSNDRIVFGNNSTHSGGEFDGQLMVFNPIDYELKRDGEGSGNTQNIINIFMNIYRMGNRIAQEGDISKEERFWDSALKRCIGKTVELLKLAGEDLSMENIFNVILSCSSKDEEGIVVSENTIAKCDLFEKKKLLDEKYNEPTYYCPLLLAKAKNKLRQERNTLSASEYDYKLRVYQQVYAYYVQFLNSLDEKTKFTIFESFMGLAEPFLSGILNKHFAGATNLFPESTFDGKIIVIDFPVKEYLDVGIIAQCVFKLMFQQAVERRKISSDTLPVFLWADEAHMFVNPYDQLFLTTARSVRCSTCYLTQNISNYIAVMGSGQDSKAKVDSLMGNLSTKIFHANSDAETNEYASRLIGKDYKTMKTKGASEGRFTVNDSGNISEALQLLPQVLPKDFTVLKSGSAKHDYEVAGIMIVSGKEWQGEKNYKVCTFSQRSF